MELWTEFNLDLRVLDLSVSEAPNVKTSNHKRGQSVHSLLRSRSSLYKMSVSLFVTRWPDFELLERKHQSCLTAEWLSEEPTLGAWIAVVFQWLQPSTRTAVWSNILVSLQKQWKVFRVIKSRLKTSHCAVNDMQQQGNRTPQLSGE